MRQQPNALVVYGSGSSAIRDYVGSVPAKWPVVRIFHATRPDPLPSCADIDRLDLLPEAITWAKSRVDGPIRLGVLGAAVASQSSLLASETDASIDEQLRTNVTNYVGLVRACLPTMISSRYGRFVYLSSFRSRVPTRGITLYGAAKAFGEAFFSGVGVEYGRLGITTASIRMGYFEGGLIAGLGEERLAEITRHVSTGRLGSGADLAGAIEFAMSAEYLNGSVIDLDGGLDLG